MPLYEFRCLKCNELFELLVMGGDDQGDMKCPRCASTAFERVMSTVSYNMTGSGGPGKGPHVASRSCAGGSCTTWDIPGPA